MSNLNYLVISTWRSGSTLCAFLLNEYVRYGIKNPLKQVIHYRKDYILEWESNTVHHSHNYENLETIPEDFTIISVIRDPFDCAISNIMAEKLQKFSYFHNEPISPVDPFEINHFKVKIALNNVENFQKKLDKNLLKIPNSVIKINYDDIKDDNQKFFELIKIDFKLTKIKNIPIKVPIDYKQVILNYKVLEEKYRI
jgi:hypothetical protein